AVVEIQFDALAIQQLLLAAVAGEGREAAVLVDVGDRYPPVEVLGRRQRDDLAGPAVAIAPAAAGVFKGGQDQQRHQAGNSRASAWVERERLSCQDQPRIGVPLAASSKVSRWPSPSRCR